MDQNPHNRLLDGRRYLVTAMRAADQLASAIRYGNVPSQATVNQVILPLRHARTTLQHLAYDADQNSLEMKSVRLIDRALMVANAMSVSSLSGGPVLDKSTFRPMPFPAWGMPSIAPGPVMPGMTPQGVTMQLPGGKPSYTARQMGPYIQQLMLIIRAAWEMVDRMEQQTRFASIKQRAGMHGLQGPPVPSSSSAMTLMSGDMQAIPRVIAHTLGRSILIALGMHVFGKPTQHVVRNSIAGALGIEVFVLWWAKRHLKSPEKNSK